MQACKSLHLKIGLAHLRRAKEVVMNRLLWIALCFLVGMQAIVGLILFLANPDMQRDAQYAAAVCLAHGSPSAACFKAVRR